MQFNSTTPEVTEVNITEELPVEMITGETVVSGHTNALATTQANMITVRDKVKQQIIASGEAQQISDKLSVHNAQSIVEFGKPAAEGIGRCADEILRRQDIQQVTQATSMMASLAKIMDKVDIGEIKDLDSEPGFFAKVFNNAQKKLDSLVAKYNNIGTEIEKVCVELRAYEGEIKQSNKDLEGLYENGVRSYQELLKYTIAGEHAMEEIAAYRTELEAQAASDPDKALELQNVVQAESLLQQRVQDLRMAESVALQSLPTIKALEFGNLNLARKINSSFIVTIPVFKNAVAQAMLAKRQAYQAQALKALDEKTNEMLLKNAQNAADNMRLTAQLSGSSAIKIETIEQSWQTIMDGIKDTKTIQAELARQREQDKEKLEEINQKYLGSVQS